MKFQTRDGRESDWPFVLSTWLKSHKHSGHGVKRVRDSLYYAFHHPRAEALLAASSLRIAFAPGDDNTILGYVVSDANALHYVYTKLPFRRFGVANALMQEVAPTATQFSYLCDSEPVRAMVRKYSQLHFNPYAEPSHVSHSSANAEADRSRPAEEWPPRH